MSGVSISDFVLDQATCKMPLGDKELVVVYRPRALTPALTERFQQMINAADAHASGVVLAEIVVSWTLTGPITGWRAVRDADGEHVKDADGHLQYEAYDVVPAGEPVPLDPNILRHVSTGAQMQLWMALQRESYTVDNPFLKKTD